MVGGFEGEGAAGASAVYNDERVCCDMAAADFHGRGSAADGREVLCALNVNWTLDPDGGLGIVGVGRGADARCEGADELPGSSECKEFVTGEVRRAGNAFDVGATFVFPVKLEFDWARGSAVNEHAFGLKDDGAFACREFERDEAFNGVCIGRGARWGGVSGPA